MQYISQMFLFVFCLLISFDGGVRPLELVELRVPAHVPLRTRAQLSCRWQLGPSEMLYSVKWYKDGKEFFRHVPRDSTPRRKFPLPGVDVEEFDSAGSGVMLAPAKLETSGRYRCEVSGEGPQFFTVSEHADMTVVVLADHGPSISGLKSKYHPGDQLAVKCTSGQSRPPTELAWYLNGDLLPGLPSTHKSSNGLATTTLVLDFKVRTVHFKNGFLRVKCLATIPPIYWISNEGAAMLEINKAHEHLDKRNTIFAKTRQRKSNSACILKAFQFLTYLAIFVIVFFLTYI